MQEGMSGLEEASRAKKPSKPVGEGRGAKGIRN